MFETYFYIDQDKLDCYLSDFSRPKKIKGGSLNVEITLPFVKISASGEFSKDISELSARQKAVLFEKLLENNENELFFDLANPDVDATTISPNSFIRLHCDLKVPEMVDMINGLTDLLKGKLSNFAQQQIIKSDASNAELIMNVLSEKKLSTPIVLECDNKSISKIDINYILEEDELDFWDEVADSCEIIAKVTQNCENSKVKLFDIGKTYFGLSRAFRRQIDNSENNPQFNVFENNVQYKLEILTIKK